MTTSSTTLSRGRAVLDRWGIHIAIPAVIAVTVAVASGSPYATFLVTSAAVAYVLTVSFNLVFGYGGIFSLASIAFYGIGAYASVYAENEWGLSFWLSFPFAALVAAAFGALLIRPTSHLREIFIAIVTLGFAIMSIEVFAQWSEVTGGAGGIFSIVPPSIGDTMLIGGEVPYLIFCSVIVWGVAELAWRISRSGFGRKLAALREAPRALSGSGVDEARVRFSVFVLSSGLAGLAGAMYAHFQLTISPESFSFLRLIELLLAVVIGGAGTYLGPVVGVVALMLIDELGANLGSLEPFVYGVAVVILMVLGRNGVVTFVLDAWRRFGPAPSAALTHELAPDAAATFSSLAHSDGDTVLTASGVVVEFGGVRAVAGVDLELSAGEVIGLVGPNGAGKTSLFNAITGEVPLTKGRVVILGKDVASVEPFEIRRRGVGRTFQLPSLVPELSLLENVMLGGESRARAGVFRQSLYSRRAVQDDRERRAEALAILRELGLLDRAFGPASDQPYGVQRLAEIARTLMLRPSVLMLDEPGAGLTDDERAHLSGVVQQLRDRNIGVIVIDHNVSFVAELSDRMVVLDHGAVIASGDPADVLSDAHVIGAYLGSEGTHG